MCTKEKQYSKKNLIGKIARRILELNEYGNWNFILSKNTYSIWKERPNEYLKLWIDVSQDITTDNLLNTLNELNRINKNEKMKIYRYEEREGKKILKEVNNE